MVTRFPEWGAMLPGGGTAFLHIKKGTRFPFFGPPFSATWSQIGKKSAPPFGKTGLTFKKPGPLSINRIPNSGKPGLTFKKPGPPSINKIPLSGNQVYYSGNRVPHLGNQTHIRQAMILSLDFCRFEEKNENSALMESLKIVPRPSPSPLLPYLPQLSHPRPKLFPLNSLIL